MNYSVSSKFVKDSFVLILTCDGQVKQEIITDLDEVAVDMIIGKVNTFLEDYVVNTTENVELEQDEDTLCVTVTDENGSIDETVEYYEDYEDFIQAYDGEEKHNTKPVRKASDSL